MGEAGATALIPLREERRDDADADELLRLLANETAGDDADELLRLNNPGTLTPAATLTGPGPARIPLTLATTPLKNPGRAGGAGATTPCARAKALIPALGDGKLARDDAEDLRDATECLDADDARDAKECLDADDARDADELLRLLANETAGDDADEPLCLNNPGPLNPGATLTGPGAPLKPLIFAPILLKNP